MATDSWINESLYSDWGQRFMVKRELARVTEERDILRKGEPLERHWFKPNGEGRREKRLPVPHARPQPPLLLADPGNREAERFIERVTKSRSSIGLQLMNQDVIAGIGNVYRAELLFRAGISPHTPGNTLTREQLQAIWDDSVKLLKVGVATGVRA